MINCTVEEAKETFAASRNLNAALKNLLKKEGANSPAIAPFAKDFRVAWDLKVRVISVTHPVV